MKLETDHVILKLFHAIPSNMINAKAKHLRACFGVRLCVYEQEINGLYAIYFYPDNPTEPGYAWYTTYHNDLRFVKTRIQYNSMVC